MKMNKESKEKEAPYTKFNKRVELRGWKTSPAGFFERMSPGWLGKVVGVGKGILFLLLLLVPQKHQVIILKSYTYSFHRLSPTPPVLGHTLPIGQDRNHLLHEKLVCVSEEGPSLVRERKTSKRPKDALGKRESLMDTARWQQGAA